MLLLSKWHIWGWHIMAPSVDRMRLITLDQSGINRILDCFGGTQFSFWFIPTRRRNCLRVPSWGPEVFAEVPAIYRVMSSNFFPYLAKSAKSLLYSTRLSAPLRLPSLRASDFYRYLERETERMLGSALHASVHTRTLASPTPWDS